MSQTKTATCMLCEASCGLVVNVGHDEAGVLRVLRTEGDRDDRFSQGYLCPKAAALDDVRLDPDRVTEPMRRTRGGSFTRVTWDAALDEASTRLAEFLDRHGPHAVSTYTGNPLVHSYGGILGSILLSQSMGSYSRFSATSVDQLPHMLASYLVLGHQTLLPVPDLDRVSHLLVLGANPLVSNGSIMTAPGTKKRLERLRARGGKIVVVDPRRTETAKVADAHHFIVPGTDALLLLAMLETIFAEGLARPERMGVPFVGLAELERTARRYPAERVADVVGIPADTIRELGRAHATSSGAACYARFGACTQEHGGLAAWLALALDAVTGNLDRPGGKMLATPAVDVAKLASRLGMRGSYARFRTKVRGLPEFGGELPVAALAEEIESEGRTKIRALVTMAGNPVSSAPNGPRLGKALETLDFMVSVDLYRNETTRHAHILLPPTFGLERDHYDLVLYAFAVRNVARYAEALFAPRGDTRHDFDILTDLAGRVLSRRKPTMKGLAARAVVGSARAMGSRRILDLLLRTGPYGTSLEALRAEPHGVDFGALEPRLAELLEGRPVDLAPKPLVEGTSRLDAQLERSTRREGELLLVGRRGLRSNNSWMHNVPRLTRGAPVCTLLVHPDDAAPRGLGSGDRVKVRSRAGELVATVAVSDEIGKGSVSLPHGYGHSGTELRVARALEGANVNDVTDETRVDTLSGTAVLNGVPVTLTKLAVGESSAAE